MILQVAKRIATIRFDSKQASPLRKADIRNPPPYDIS